MFDVARFAAECEAVVTTDRGRNVVREILTAAVSDPAGIAPRNMWDGETLAEAPLDHQRDDRVIEAYNARLID
jgi:hypothetical protein